VTSALAFDPRFTAAYQQGSASAEPVNVQQQKAAAEDRQGRRLEASVCFFARHVYGACC